MVKKKTHQQFLKEIKYLYGDDYILHKEYTKNSNKITVEHTHCGYEWNVLPNNLLRGLSNCPSCNGKHNRSQQEFINYVTEKTNGEFSSMGDFKGNNYIATFKHNVCGYVFQSTPQIVQKGEIGCRKCSNMLVHDKERVELLLEDKYGNEYILLSDEVKNNRDIILIKHTSCDNEFETTSTKIINGGSRCTHCNKKGSNGEIKIENYLKQNIIKHIREYTFDDCRHKSVLFFDFAIFDENNNLRGLIEFDGKQHFEPIEFFGGEVGFIEGKIRDEIKNKYCKNNNIPLLRIPYWEEDNIDEIIPKYLDEFPVNYNKEVA